MTPAEQAAREIVCAGGEPDTSWQRHMVDKIAQAIEQARREEREACAKYHDNQAGWYENGGDELMRQTSAALAGERKTPQQICREGGENV